MRTCRCGRPVEARQCAQSDWKWYVMCNYCILSTENFDSKKNAEDAWDRQEYTEATTILQKPLKRPEDLDLDGCIELVRAIYSLALHDYEEALPYPEVAKEYRDKHYISVRKEVEDMYRYGYYTGMRFGDAGVQRLKDLVEERAKSRENQAS